MIVQGRAAGKTTAYVHTLNFLEKLIWLINQHEQGEVLTRKYIIWWFYGQMKDFSESTIDSYRRYLTAAGFLNHSERGKYTVLLKIPNMTEQQLRYLAYPKKENQ